MSEKLVINSCNHIVYLRKQQINLRIKLVTLKNENIKKIFKQKSGNVKKTYWYGPGNKDYELTNIMV